MKLGLGPFGCSVARSRGGEGGIDQATARRGQPLAGLAQRLGGAIDHAPREAHFEQAFERPDRGPAPKPDARE